MARPAGSDDIVTAQAGARVGDGQDVMGAVAVITFGRFRESQLGDLSVIGIEIGLGDIGMATPALVHDFQLETVGVRPPYGMGTVTIAALRDLIPLVALFLRMNAPAELVLDSVMAVSASPCDIIGIDAGHRIPAGKFMVGRVTVRTCRRHDQAALEKPFAVDALLIMIRDFVLASGVTDGRFLALPMTAGTEAGNIQGEGRRFRIEPASCPVRPVAFQAGGCVRILTGREEAVRAGQEFFGDTYVAGGAIDLGRDILTGTAQGSLNAGVTLTAGNPTMPGLGEFGRIDDDGPAICRLKRFLFVTFQAVAVGHALNIEDLADLMGLMTVDTSGKNGGLFFPEFPFNHLAMDGLDLGMALGAGCGDVPPGNCGPLIRMGEDLVGGMTGGTCRADDQPFVHEALSMDALRIILKDAVLMDLPLELDGGALPVAPAADEWNLKRGDGGTRIFYGMNAVISMTILAAGRKGIALYHRFAMQTFIKEFLLDIVTRAAGYSVYRCFMREILPFEGLMAGNTAQRFMNRTGQDRFVDEQGDGASASPGRQIPVAVADETILALLAPPGP